MSTRSGARSHKEKSKRVLVRWTDDHDKTLLLAMQYACTESGIKIPWEKVAEVMGPNFSEGAIVQHLAKLRGKMVEAEIPVPPPIKRGMVTKTPSKIYGTTPKKRNIAEAAAESSTSVTATTKRHVTKTRKNGKKKDKSLASDGENEEEEDIEVTSEEEEIEPEPSSRKRKKSRRGAAVKEEFMEEDIEGTPGPVSPKVKNETSSGDSDGPATRTRRITLCYGKQAAMSKSDDNVEDEMDGLEEEEDDDADDAEANEETKNLSSSSPSSSSSISDVSDSQNTTAAVDHQTVANPGDGQVFEGNANAPEVTSHWSTPFNPAPVLSKPNYHGLSANSNLYHGFQVPGVPTHAYPNLRINTAGPVYGDYRLHSSPSFLDGFSTPVSTNSSFGYNSFLTQPSPITPTAISGMSGLNLDVSHTYLSGMGHSIGHNRSQNQHSNQDELPSSSLTDAETNLPLFDIGMPDWDSLIHADAMDGETGEPATGADHDSGF